MELGLEPLVPDLPLHFLALGHIKLGVREELTHVLDGVLDALDYFTKGLNSGSRSN